MSQITEANRPVKRSEVSKLRWTWQEMKNNKTAYFMLAPFMLLFIIFTVLPVVLSIFLSLTDFNMLQMPHFLGIDNMLKSVRLRKIESTTGRTVNIMNNSMNGANIK